MVGYKHNYYSSIYLPQPDDVMPWSIPEAFIRTSK